MDYKNTSNGGLPFSEQQIRRVLGSPEGQKLLQLLSRDGGAALRQAAQAMRALGIAYLPDFNRFSTREIHALPGMDDDAMARLNAVLLAHGVPPKAYPLL